MLCEICGTETNFFRCPEHKRCDDCGTTENLCYYTEGELCDDCHKQRVEKRIAEFKGKHAYQDFIICPWCGYRINDSWEFAGKSGGTIECSDCGHEFEYEVHHEVTYTTIVGENHD